MLIEIKLNEINDLVVKMFDSIFEQYIKTETAINEVNVSLALEVVKDDNLINEIESDIFDACLLCIAKYSPVATDLRHILGIIKISSDLERIGDYAANICEYVITSKKVDEKISKYILEIHQELYDMMKNTKEAFINDDKNLAKSTSKQDAKIDKLFIIMLEEIAEYESRSDLREALHTSIMLRNYERCGDHLVNVCEEIGFMVKGKKYDW